MFIFIPLLAILGLTPTIGKAIQILPPCTANGNCQICDFVLGFMNIIRWGFGIVGGVAILLIIVAGVGWILSQGNPDKVKKARNRVLAVVTGLVIMLVAWQVTNFLVATLTLSNSPAGTNPSQQQAPSIFSLSNGTIWYNACSNNSAQPCAGKGDGAPCTGSTGYCLAGQCKTDKSACEFINTDPRFAKYYIGYACRASNLCDFNRDLGAGYCASGASHCCAVNN